MRMAPLIKSLTAFLITALLGCSKVSENKTDTAPLASPNATQSAEGGITSGGGGTLPADPVTTFEVFDTLKQAQTELRLFLNVMTRSPKKYADMFSSERFLYQEKSVAWALENTGLEYFEDKPCYDELGLPVDGSYLHSKPNLICISGFSTAPKLIKETLKKEIYALIIHELAHRVGANEEEARELQQMAAAQLPRFIKDLGVHTVQINTAIQFEHPLFNKGWIAENFKKNFAQSTLDEKLAYVNRLIESTQKSGFDIQDPERNGSLNYKTIDLEVSLDRGLFLMKGALLLEKGGLIDSIDQISVDYYNETFSKSDKMSIHDIGQLYNQSMLTENFFAHDLVYTKIGSQSDYIKYLNIFEIGFRYFESYGFAIVLQNKLPELPVTLFKDVNPWLLAAGKYKLIQKSCDMKNYKFSDLVGLEITENVNKNVDFKFINSTGSTGYGDVNNQYGNFIFKDGNDYVFQLTTGTRWPNESSTNNYQEVEEIKLSNNQLVITYQRFNYTPAPLQTEVTKSCIYDLIKE